jgi:hypothetical protein
MYGRSVLVDCPSRLGTAATVLTAEIQHGDGVLTTQARERGHAVDHFDDVMSHSFKSSPLSRYDSEPKLLRLENGIQAVCQRRKSVDSSQFFILYRQGDGNRRRFLFPLTLHLCKTGCNISRLQVERKRKASGRISIECEPLFFSYQEVSNLYVPDSVSQR